MASVNRGGCRSGIELRKLRYWGADGLPIHGRQHEIAALRQVAVSAPRSQRPCTCVLILGTRNRGRSRLYPSEMVTGGSASEGEEPNEWRVRKWEVGQTHRSLDVDEQR